ncbi:MAG: ABC transporter ATP-binding protein [Clostridia bacterium]
MENILEIKKLSKTYSGFSLKDIDLNIPKGSIVGLIGENGAGKSTTIKLILNQIKKSSGEIKIFGKDNIQDEKEIKKDIGAVLDSAFLSEYLTVEDINKIMKNFYENWSEDKFFKDVEKASLPRKKLLKEFSTGMKMKVQIITALAHDPKLLILDEPTNGLDPVARNELLDIFREFIQDEEKSILISSHITTDLEHIADYIVFIHSGSILLSMAKDELLENYALVKCKEKEFANIDSLDYVRYIKNAYGYDLLVQNKREFKKKYSSLVIDKVSIEDIMLLYVKGEK